MKNKKYIYENKNGKIVAREYRTPPTRLERLLLELQMEIKEEKAQREAAELKLFTDAASILNKKNK
tara:strand:- start:587 stop:784 length:198 start_codon:yes stop_codon:yes gene_type:complete